jgi:hypothetical protein
VKNRSGQAMTETVLMLPFYLILAFGLIQIGQLATALIVANYAASAIARQAVQDGNTGNTSAYEARLDGLMMAGMKSGVVKLDTDGTGIMKNVTVHACAQIDALPFLGQFLGAVFKQNYGGGGACDDSGAALGPFFFNGGPPYYFRVHGRSTARMNYKP